MKRFLGVMFILGACSAAALATEIDPVVTFDNPQRLDGNEGGAALVNVYSNTSASVLQTGSLPRWHELDDGSFTSGPFAGTGGLVTGANHGFFVNNATSSFDMNVRFYNTMNGATTPVNSGLLGGYTLRFSNLAVGAYTTGLFTYASLALPDILFPDDNWGIELSFFDVGTTTPNANATGAFSGDGTEVGSSVDVYWRDANGNGVFSTDESRTFGGGTSLANFYLQLVPEPSSLVLIGLGALPMLRRRS